MQYQSNTKIYITLFLLILLSGCGNKTKTIPYTGPSSSTSSQQSTTKQEAVYRATMKPYTVFGKKYYPTIVSSGDTFSGVASWYGAKFHGKKTSNGETYDMHKLTAAHKTFPMNTIVKVINLNNKKSTIVRINDRGPFVGNRIIDLSYEGAKKLDFISSGTTPVRLEVLSFDGIVPKGGSVLAKQSIIISDYSVQIGAFRRFEGANIYKTHHNHNKDRYEAIIQNGEMDNEPIYRVWLRGFGGEDEARDFISEGKYSGAFIIRESKWQQFKELQKRQK